MLKCLVSYGVHVCPVSIIWVWFITPLLFCVDLLLFCTAAKLAPVGYGIKKLQIMMTIVDDLVSVDNLIEDYLLVEPANEYLQSCVTLLPSTNLS